MIGVLAILGAVLVLALILRLGTAALVVSGLSRDIARFQVRSAFFGVGFTTSESEAITSHPFRRRLVQTLMLLGSFGITGIIGSAILTFARTDEQIVPSLVVLVAGLAAIYALTCWRRLDRALVQLFERLLRRFTALEAQDYDALLRLSESYAIRQYTLGPAAPATGRAIGDVIGDHPILLLGLERDGAYLGTPSRATVLRAGDRVTVYGRDELLDEITARQAAAAPR